MWAAQGHHVKFVSVTNGDIGHWREAGGPLALRRTKEVQEASKILGTNVEVLDIMTEKTAKPHTLTSFARVDGERVWYPAD